MISHLFTSSAFVLTPFAGSPLHFNQNFSSSFFNSEGLRTQIEAPGISFSLRSDARNVANAAMFVLLWPHWPHCSYHSSRAVRYYESRVCYDVFLT